MTTATLAVADINRRFNLSRGDHNSCLSATTSSLLLRPSLISQNGGEMKGEWICSRSVSRSVKVSSDVAIARSLLRIRLGTAVIVRLEKLTDERTQSEAGFNRSVDYISKLLLEIIVFRKLFPWVCGNWDLGTCVVISLSSLGAHHISLHP